MTLGVRFVMLKERTASRTRAAILACACFFSLARASVAGETVESQIAESTLSEGRQQKIARWVLELDHDDYRTRSAAQRKLEDLTGRELVFAKQQLTEKPSLEYMTRRERILKVFDLTAELEQLSEKIRAAKIAGESDVLGLAAYCRLVESDPEVSTTRTLYELRRECQNYLVTVYAAPRYAQDTVRSEIRTAVRSGNRSDWETDTMALRWISIFLTLCDKNVQLNDRKISSELSILSSNLQILSMEFALLDRQHGAVLRSLISKFISSAGERGEAFAKSQRATLAAKLQLEK